MRSRVTWNSCPTSSSVRGRSPTSPKRSSRTRAGKLTRVGLPTPGGLLEAAVLATSYREMVTLLFPPPIVQRLLLTPLARLAHRRGMRAGSFASL